MTKALASSARGRDHRGRAKKASSTLKAEALELMSFYIDWLARNVEKGEFNRERTQDDPSRGGPSGFRGRRRPRPPGRPDAAGPG
ncbi:MAG: hypothetical protein MZU95_09070 [Desulfomicrobium escambiense]|nr:hypothetical protein [Desulfomicrobium escambiense]